MPYEVMKEGDKFRVVKSDTGDIAKNAAGTAIDGGGHESRARALAQVKALYAAEAKRSKK